MSRDIYIGVDGGGTKTQVRIEDSEGQLLGQAVGGPANIRLSVPGAWQSILTAIEEILTPLAISLNDPHYRFHAGLGLAGCEVKSTYDAFVHYPHPFTRCQVVSDAHIACLGAHHGREGAIIIIGTGVVGYQWVGGLGMQVSGWGFPHDDEGSGAWLGLEAARLTFQAHDHRIVPSSLTREVLALFDHQFDTFVAWANDANSTAFARLAPLVIRASEKAEVNAVRLMKRAAHAIDCVAEGLAKMHDVALPCSLFGGLAPFIEPWLSEALRQRLVNPKADAVVGAIWMMREGAIA